MAYSSGKDSTRAVYEAKLSGEEVCCLLTVTPKCQESYMFHYPNTQWTTLQAEAMGLPLIRWVSRGLKEAEVEDLVEALREAIKLYAVECLYTGAVASSYQRKRFEYAASKLGLGCVSPLWGMGGEQILRDLLRLGFKAMVVGVSAAGLGQEWLGRVIDEKAIEDLKAIERRHGINLSFEGGEAETFVLDAPLFNRRI